MDLEAACALLSDAAENYHAEAGHRATNGSDSEVVLSPAGLPIQTMRCAGPARSRRGLVMMLSAASVAVFLAVGIAAVGVSSKRAQTVAGAGDDGVPRSVPFAIRPSADLELVGVGSLIDGEQEFSLYAVGTLFVATMYGGHARPHMTFRTAQRVDVGSQRGYFACFTPHVRTSSPGRCAGWLAWRSPSGEWLDVAARAMTRSALPALLNVARGMDLTRHTRYRSPISISTAPAGTRLQQWVIDTDVQKVHGKTPTAADDWSVDVAFEPTSARTGFVTVDASTGQHLPTGRGRHVNIDGHRGVWDEASHHLWIGAGRGVVLMIIGDPPTFTNLDQIRAFVRTITIASRPEDHKTWFVAAYALP